MASRHEIISIDFRANAAKANPAMDALRESAKNMRTEVEKTKTAISDGIKTGKSQEELDKLGAKLRTQERELKSFETAMNTLAKGVTTLSRAIDAFNTGTLDQMSAAFQKASYNAAETAKKALLPGTKDYQKNMAELDALQQKNLENLAKYKLRTEQMLQSIGKEGSKISSQDLKQEADGIQELMRLLPHMSHEWLEYNDILKQVNAAIKQQTDDEKRLTGAIVDANDARERSSQLTRNGVEEAARQRKEAENEVKQRTENIAALKEERAEKAKQVSIDAANAIAKDKEVEKQRKVVAAIQERIDNEKKDAEREQKNIDKLNQEATAYENNAKSFREAAETMKGDVKGIDDELKHVNEELAKMGTSAGPDAAGASADKVSVAKEKEAQSTDKSTEAVKKEQQASKDSAAAKKEETKATEENTVAKEKGAKAGETAAKVAENEKVTVESLIKRNDELKIKIAALNEERKQMLATQEKNAAAVKEEANAYKDLSKEQAQAMLDQKQQLATFKKEGEKWQIGNREEAQRYLFDALGEINPANVGKTTMSIENSPEKISQLLGKFQERYGIEGEGEAMAAVRELMSGGGLVKNGFMNKFFMNVEENVPKVAAYSKEIKDLAAVINGEVKAVEEDTEKKRTLADVEAELEAAEKESRDISIQAMKMRNGQADATEGLTQKTVKLTDAQKERIATIKAETEAIKQMSQAEAKAALEEAKKVSTVGYKAGKLHMSDPEEVQQFLIGKMRTIGKVKNDNGTLSLAGGQVDALVSAFQQRYDWKDDKTNAKALLKKILQGKDGMFMGGTADLSGDIGSVTIQYAKEMYDARLDKMRALVDVSNGVKKATDEVSDATHRSADAAKDATEATNGQTDAIKAQEAEVMRRKAALDKMNEEYEQADKKLKDMRQRYASLPSSGTDAALAKAQLKDEIDDYNENVVKKARADKNRLKKLWEKSVSDLTKMMGISTEETQKSTAAQNQETEAIEKGAKGRGRKKKAVEDATQAMREETKAEGDAAKQQEQLSEQDQKRIALEQKKQELEAKRGQKIDEITKKEEAAAAADVRANNNRSEARQITEELAQAHGKNADALDKESEKLKKSEFEQGKLNDKVNEGRKALAEYDQKIDDNAEKRLEAQKKQAQAQRLTIDTMTEAIKVLEARNRAIEPESEEWVKNARLIRQYQAELDRLKQQPVLQLMIERMGSIRTLSADALQETKKFWQTMADGSERGSHQLEVYEGNLRVIAEEERQRQQQIQQPMRQRLNNLGNLSTADLAETKRYWETVRDGADQTTAAYKKAELAVKALTNEENRRKANAQAQYINEQMRDLNNLSTAGLTDVKRYWQAMADGARKGTDEAKDAEAALKRINEIESERRRTSDKQQVRTLFGDLSKKNGEEIRAAIEAGRRLIDTYDSGGPAAKRLSQAILDAEEHLKQYGIEAERSARREAQALEEAAQRRKEQDQLMRQQLDQGTSLSESALKTQQQYWQRLIDDPKTAKESLAGYRYELERTIALQEQQASVTREERAARLNGNLRDYSTAEIREAIEAAKQLAASYKSGSTEATELTKKIVAAEEHINKYGLETERAAQKQREQIDLMEEQLRRGTGLTETALKQQESYWRRLADDPKAAANEIARYFENLNKVHALQKEQAESQTTAYGLNALNFFRGDTSNASADQIKEQAKALKAYRDSLPSKDKADVIAEIDGYLKAAGVSAKGATDDVMDLKTALDLAEKAGQWNKGDFAYSPQEIQAATKALEIRREELIRQIRAERDLGNAVDAQEKELDDLTKKLRSLKFEQDNVNMSQEKMRTLIETPANAVNLDELRAAIKRADGQLRQMEQSLGQNSSEYKRFAEQVRNAKNVMKEMEGQAKASATAWEKAFSRLKTYVVMYMGFNEVWQKVTGTARDLMDLSDRMGEVRKTTGFTADEVGRLSDNLTKLDTRTNLTGLMEFSSLAGSVGLKTQEAVQGFTEAANMLSVSLPELGKEASRTLMKIADATGDLEKNGNNVRETLERVGSTVIALRANSAAAAGPITDFVSRVGAVGAQAGISIDQIAALGATVDALGGRVEMSATALSRMIPAIRNNTFEVAQAIGMTEKQLKQMSGIDQMVAVFKALNNSVKNFDMTTEEGMNAAADAVEGMLGRSVSMQDVMKQLNQQGARAGIVFGLLSQNVDTLEKQLKIATDAYRDNTALMEEYNKMNETTAAKWERLKNQLEEAFVSDSIQRGLGSLIDMLRGLVDFITGNVTGVLQGLRTAFLMLAAAATVYRMELGKMIFVESLSGLSNLKKALVGVKDTILLTAMYTKDYIALKWKLIFAHGAEEKAAIRAKIATLGLNKALTANVWMAVVAAIGMLLLKLYQFNKAAKEAAAETGRFNQQIADEQKALNKLFEPLNRSNMAQEERLKLINEINSKYGKYLGYMLSETSSAIALADAHALIAKRIKEEAYEKRIAEKEAKIQDEHSEDVNAAYTKITERVRGSVRGGASAQEIADVLKGIVDNRLGSIKYAYDDSDNIFKARTNYYLDPKIKQAIDGGIERLIVDGKLSRDNVTLIQKAVYKYTVEAHSQHKDIMNQTSNLRSDLRGVQSAIKVDLANNLNTLVSRVASSVGNAVRNIRQQQQPQQNVPLMLQQPQGQGSGLPSLFGGGQQGGWQAPWQQGRETTPQQQAAPKGWKPNIDKKDTEAVRQFVQDQEALRSALNASGNQIDEAQRRVAESWLLTDAELKEYKKIVEKADRGPGGSNYNPYGDYNKVTSPYKDWNGNDLVARRKEMLERVKALANGADVQAVLSEDAKFISDAVRKNIKTTDQAIEWYNTERLKIQEALHGKHLTNTGDWQDPKKVRKRVGRVVNDEMKYYLDELDAYYTERKTRIEQARNDEEITEGEAWRRTIQNDNEWQTRRAELQLLYSRRAAKVTEDEMQAIFDNISERTGETVSYIKADIAQTNKFIVDVGNKSKAAMDRIYGDIELGAEKSYLKAAQAIGKQMKFIEDTLAKERPYDGITKNLQDNLDKMGVLAAKYRRENEELARQGKEPKYSNEQITAQSYDEMAFYLRQAADAYSIDIDELLRRMVKEGMTATAEEISKSDMLKQAVMGQLRKTYQEVQDAVKKEASQIKKDVEIIWNDDARGIGGMSMKATFDKALAQLGMQQDSVSRANSLIGAGAASDNVASRLAMKQIEVQMRMQKAQYDMYRVQANQRMAALKAEAEEHRRLAKQMEKENHLAESKRELLMATNAERDAENVRLSLGLTLAEETKKEEEQKAELLKLQEESQNRLYQSLREWADLLTSSLQGVFEASHAGDAEYYNELAKLNLTGKGGPGAGTYMVIDDAGTSDATAHYEYLDERQALERQHEIEVQNAQAEAWRKLMDDMNMKMNEQITDWVNASLQDAAVKDNTDALLENTRAIYESMSIETGEPKPGQPDALPSQPQPDKPSATVEPIVIPGGSTNTEAPKVVGTDPENTSATNANTAALNTLTQVLTGQPATGQTGMGTSTAGTDTTATAEGDISLQKPFFQMSAEETAAAMEMIRQMWQTYNEGGTEALQMMAESLAAMEGIVLPPWQVTEEGMATAMERMGALWQSYAEQGIAAMQQMSDAMAEMPNKIPDPTQLTEEHAEQAVQNATNMYQGLGEVQVQAQQDVTDKVVEGNKQQEQSTKQRNKQTEQSTKSTYSAMTAAMNMYGTAYQIMSNDNMDMTQKFQMFALQAAGQTAIGMLTTNMLATDAQGKVELPGILGKAASQLGPIAGPIAFAAMTALLGGLMAVAMSSVNKSKSQIAQVTGASVGAGRLSTGLLTYAEGNVNELTDPASLTPGRQYNVDGADGKTYRARYMGKGAKTHITNGPEFHLVGEAGREAIIDAKTTRLLQMNETGIWRDIQTLYNGGSISGLSTRRRRGTGVRAFADGNIGEFEEMADGGGLTAEGMGGFGAEQMAAFQTSLDRNNELLERALTNGIKGVFGVYGPDGIVNAYDTGKKNLQRHGVDY